MDWVDDGYPDCEDGSDESDNHDHDDHGDDDHNDHHDDGNHISWYSYHDGYCEWEGYSDATDAGEDSRWWCKISQDDEDWENWWYYCEHHDSDWHCTDDFGQSEEFEHSADNDEWSDSEDGEDGHDDGSELGIGLLLREDRYPPTSNLDGANICVGIGTSIESYLVEWFSSQDLSMTSVPIDDVADAQQKFIDGNCDAIAGEMGNLDTWMMDVESDMNGVGMWIAELDDDDIPPSPEDAMNMTDADGDGYMSQDEFVTYWNNENSDAPIDSDQSFLTTEDVEDLIELCDYDVPSDLIDINEMQCFIDNLVGMMPDDENTPSLDDFFNHFDTDGDGHLTATEFIDANDVPDEDQDGVHDMFDMYDNDESGGLDYYEFEPLYDMMVDSDDGDDGDGMERNDATGFVAENQTLNAPITDFEVHFLSDCEEEYDEEEDQMIQPDLSACTNEFSIPLTGGEAEGVTITYTDHDGDGLVSPGDEMSVEWGDYDGEEIDKMEIYDTYASQYSSESAAMPPVLPGFGAILGALALLGAAIASRRD